MSKKPKRILAIRLSAMGDVAIAVPALHAMRSQYPHAELYVLSNAAFAPLFEHIEGLHFIGIKLKDYKGIKGLYRLYKELKRYKFDLIADLHNVIRSKVIRNLFRLSGTQVNVINKGRKEKRALTRKTNKHKTQLETSAERYADVFRSAGFQLCLNFTSLYTNKPNDEPCEKVKNLLATITKPIIGIAPFAKHTGKIYPLDQMEEVVKYFNLNNTPIFLFGGGAEEKAILADWENRYNNCISVVGLLNLSEELQLISQLNVMLSMDSGNMHLASLVDTPVVSIWGATHAFAGFYGWGQNPADIVQVDLPCRPCSVYGNKPCYLHNTPYACLKHIAPQMVIEKLNQYL